MAIPLYVPAPAATHANLRPVRRQGRTVLWTGGKRDTGDDDNDELTVQSMSGRTEGLGATAPRAPSKNEMARAQEGQGRAQLAGFLHKEMHVSLPASAPEPGTGATGAH